jgi:PadR family transcriptional regulator PadR
MGKPVDLVQGTLDLLILKAIAAAPLHGWAVAQRINQLSRDVLRVNQGSLYPALQGGSPRSGARRRTTGGHASTA